MTSLAARPVPHSVSGKALAAGSSRRLAPNGTSFVAEVVKTFGRFTSMQPKVLTTSATGEASHV